MKTKTEIKVPAGADLEEMDAERKRVLATWADRAIRVKITNDVEGILLLGREGMGQLIENGELV